MQTPYSRHRIIFELRKPVITPAVLPKIADDRIWIVEKRECAASLTSVWEI